MLGFSSVAIALIVACNLVVASFSLFVISVTYTNTPSWRPLYIKSGTLLPPRYDFHFLWNCFKAWSLLGAKGTFFNGIRSKYS